MDINDTVITVVDGDINDADERMTIGERLDRVAQEGDIERFYGLLVEDPNILERFDRSSFCETPLHVAARHGRTHFAMELMTLKPSLAWKLNESGFSPVHLALQYNCFRLVRGFVAIDKDLINLKGRGRITPLHYVAQTGNAELLSEFLTACPSSIEELTIKCETAVHITVKNHKFYAFKALLGWLERVNREEILNWKDEDGNNVFHIATKTNQTEVMKLLRKTVNVNAKNLDGLTAMDIFQSNRASLSPDMNQILHGANAEAAHKLSGSTTTLAGYLSQTLSLVEKRNKLLGLDSLSDNKQGAYRDISDSRSSMLVVAILIATATYQAGLSPPGGYWQDNSAPNTVNNTTSPGAIHNAGQMTMPPFFALFFYSFNGIAFFSSVSVILILIIGLPMWKILYGSTVALGIANLASFAYTFPYPGDAVGYLVRSILIMEYPVITLLIAYVPFAAFLRNEARRRQVDFPAARYFSSSHEITW